MCWQKCKDLQETSILHASSKDQERSMQRTANPVLLYCLVSLTSYRLHKTTSAVEHYGEPQAKTCITSSPLYGHNQVRQGNRRLWKEDGYMTEQQRKDLIYTSNRKNSSNGLHRRVFSEQKGQGRTSWPRLRDSHFCFPKGKEFGEFLVPHPTGGEHLTGKGWFPSSQIFAKSQRTLSILFYVCNLYFSQISLL